MPTRNINLTEHYDQFVEELVENGEYQNASEVLRAGLRLLEQKSRIEQEQLSILKQLAAEGFAELDQGRGLSLSSDNALMNTVSKIGRRAARKAKTKVG